MNIKKITIGFSLIISFIVAASVFAGNPSPGTGAVNFTVMNTETSGDATVNASYIDQSGTVVATIPKTISASSSQGFPISKSGLPAGFAGSAIVSSDKEIVAFAQMIWSGGAHGDGKSAGAYNGFSAGANTLYFPSLKALAGNQFSILAIQSAEAASSSEEITFEIKFYDRKGKLDATLSSQTVKKGAQKSIDLLDDVDLPANWNGSAVVASSSPIAGVATTHWKEYSTAYSAITSGGTTAYIPEARRRFAGGKISQYAGIIVQNLDLATDSQVTVKWFDRTGKLLHSFDDTISANSSKGYNTRFGADIPDFNALSAALGEAYNGSVIVESKNNTKIAAVTNLQWAVSSTGPAGTSFTSFDSGTNQVLIPASFRRGSNSTKWSQYTGVIVQNVSATDACNDFTVKWFDRSGANLLTYTDSLDSGISHGFNTRFVADIPASASVDKLGTDFRGSILIEGTGSCELVAIHNTIFPDVTDSTTYQGIGK